MEMNVWPPFETPPAAAAPQDEDEMEQDRPMPLLEIKNLHVEIDGKKILNGLDLSVNPGEVHAIMGPDGSGKSTLAYVLAGKNDYEVTKGQVLFEGDDVLEMEPD